jgi:hypothetical protein
MAQALLKFRTLEKLEANSSKLLSLTVSKPYTLCINNELLRILRLPIAL